MLPDISILILTFNRPAELRRTLNALIQNIAYDGHIHWLVSDDSTGGNYLEDLRAEYPFITFISTPQRSGWGRNFNLAYQRLATSVFYFTEDDYLITRKLDFNPGVALLSLNPNIGLVRYDGIAGHVDMELILKEQAINRLVPTFDQGLKYATRYQYLEVQPVGACAFTYSNRPSLRHKRFHDTYGMYIEGYKLGDTELEYTMRVREVMRQNVNNPRIVVPLEWTMNFYDDIGQSSQLSSNDIGERIEALHG